MEYSRRPSYQAAQQRDWHPLATYTLLGVILAVYIAQLAVLAISGADLHRRLFVVDYFWYLKPWTLVTATLAHSPATFFHIIFNGIVLFFFGPILERLIGRQRFVILFFLAGAVASLAQVYFSWFVFNSNLGGLGASGALFMILGALVIVMPNEKILIWGILPVPFWVAAIGFALIDILGALNPGSGVGNVAHLSGMVIGLWIGWQLREKMRKQGLRLVRG